MESKIETSVKESLSIAEKKFKVDRTIQQFENIQKEFKEMVKKGIATERGNRLLSISDSKSISRSVFNTK